VKFKKFMISCKSCGSQNVNIWPGYDGDISITCSDCEEFEDELGDEDPSDRKEGKS
jgi:hypothetical protein